MENIITLLNDKNYHLQKFHELNAAELINFTEGNFDNIEVFYQSRETILDLIRCIDRLIEAAIAMADPRSSAPLAETPEGYRHTIREVPPESARSQAS